MASLPSKNTQLLFSSASTGLVHQVADSIGLGGGTKGGFSKRGAMMFLWSAVSDAGGAVISPMIMTPKPDEMDWGRPIVSGLLYPALDMALQYDGRSFMMQFLLQAGSSVVGNGAYNALLKNWAAPPAASV